MVRIHPLVNVRTAGVGFWFGPAEFWFSVVHPLSSVHSLPPAGAGVAVSLTVDQDPVLSAWVSGTLPFLLVLEAVGRPSTPLVCQPQPRMGCEVTSSNTCTFLGTNVTSYNSTGGGAAAPFQKPQPLSDESCLTSSVLTFPKRCLTGFVLTAFIDECRACLGSVFFVCLFSP